jgi:hypothetical protein
MNLSIILVLPASNICLSEYVYGKHVLLERPAPSAASKNQTGSFSFFLVIPTKSHGKFLI